MTSLKSIALLLLTVFAFTSCRDTPESLAEERVELYQEGTEIFNNIAGGKDVERNLERLEKWADEMRENQRKSIALQEKEDEKNGVTDKYVLYYEPSTPKFKAAYQDYAKAYNRVVFSKNYSLISPFLEDVIIPYYLGSNANIVAPYGHGSP